MLLKILLTALVIAGAVMTIRSRQQRSPPYVSTPSIAAPPRKRPLWPRLAVYGLLFLLLAGSTFYLVHQWNEAYRVVSLRVINSSTGEVVLYEAYKGDIEERSFLTVDGRRVTLAEVERLETGSVDPSR